MRTLNQYDISPALRTAVTDALLNDNISTYVDEDQDIIDGILSEVIDTVVKAALTVMTEVGLIKENAA